VFGGAFTPPNHLLQESHVLIEDFRRANALVEIEGNNPIVLVAPLVYGRHHHLVYTKLIGMHLLI
jgi:hypothetical protein